MKTLYSGLKILFFALVLQLFLIAGLFAQGKEMLLFEEIEVTTASRVAQKITKAPVAITVITEEEIKKYGAKTLLDILKILPGLTFRQAGTKAIVSPRGWTTSAHSSTVLFMIDGRPVNSLLQGDFDINYKFPINCVKRIEVIKGPGSALYGANAFTGVINIITKDADDVNKAELSGSYGSDFTRYFDAAIKFEDKERSGAALFFLHDYETAGQSLVNDNEEASVKDIYAKYILKDVTLSAGINKIHEGIAGKSTAPSMDNYRDIELSFLDFVYKRDIKPNVNLSFRGYTNYQKETTLNSIFENATLGNDTQFTIDLNEQNQIVTGFEVRDTRAKKFEDDNKYKATILAGYVQDELKVNDAFSVTLGGRYDVHSVYDDVFSPRIAAVYNASDDLTFKLSYGSAFNAPTFTELYYDIWPYGENTGIHIVANDELKPEKIQTVEAYSEIKLLADNALVFSVSGFYNYARDTIILTAIPQEAWVDLCVENKNKVTGSGAETEIKGKITKYFTWFANYTYQDVQDKETKQRLAYSPWYIVNGGVSVKPLDYLTISLKAHNVGDRVYYSSSTGAVAGTIESYTISDLNFLAEHNDVQIGFTINNVGAKKYYYDTPGYPMPQRSWLLTFGTKI